LARTSFSKNSFVKSSKPLSTILSMVLKTCSPLLNDLVFITFLIQSSESSLAVSFDFVIIFNASLGLTP
jgi:hypothetical protein